MTLQGGTSSSNLQYVSLKLLPVCSGITQPCEESGLEASDRFAINDKSQAAQRPFAHTLAVRETGFKTLSERRATIQELYAALAADAKRNQLILDDVIEALEHGLSPILLTERKDHLEYFATQQPMKNHSRITY